jgi:YD repeat-containing protein
MNKKRQNFFAVGAYLTRLCSSLMHDIAGIGSAPRYDLLGNRTRMVDPDQGVFSYAYNAAGHLTTFTDPQGLQTTFSYDEIGRLVATDLPNLTHTVRDFDENNLGVFTRNPEKFGSW